MNLSISNKRKLNSKTNLDTKETFKVVRNKNREIIDISQYNMLIVFKPVNTEEELKVAEYLYNQLLKEYREQFEILYVLDEKIYLRRIKDGPCSFCKKEHRNCGCIIECNDKGELNYICERDKFYNKIGNLSLDSLKIKKLDMQFFSLETPMYMLKYLWMFNKLSEGEIGQSQILYMAFKNNLIIAKDQDTKCDRMLWNDKTKSWIQVSCNQLIINARDILVDFVFDPMRRFIESKALLLKVQINKLAEEARRNKEVKVNNDNTNNDEFLINKITEKMMEKMEKKFAKKRTSKKDKDNEEYKIPTNKYDIMLSDLETIEDHMLRKVQSITNILKPISGINGATDTLIIEKMDTNPDLFALGDGKVADFNLIPMNSSIQELPTLVIDSIMQYSIIKNPICDIVKNPCVVKLIFDYYPLNIRHVEDYVSGIIEVDEKDIKDIKYFEDEDYVEDEELEIQYYIKSQLKKINLGVIYPKVCLKELIRDRRKEDLISIVNDIKFNPDANDPRFMKMLNDMFGIITDSNWRLPLEFRRNKTRKQIEAIEAKLHIISEIGKEKILSLQELLGYCLTGHVNMEKAWIWYSYGRGGKGLIAEFMKAIMGDYFVSLPHELFTSKKNDAEAATPFYVTMNKKRAGFVDESDDKEQLNPLFKSTATGASKVARKLWGNPEKIKIMGKLIFCLNRLLETSEWTESHWKRFVLLTFPFHFTDDPISDCTTERKINDKLKGIVNDNLIVKQTILNWALEGAVRFYQNDKSVTIPKSMRNDLTTYRSMSDSYIRWKQAALKMGPKEKMQAKLAYESYESFCTMHQDSVNNAKKNGTKKICALGGKLNKSDFWKKLQDEFRNTHPQNKSTYHGASILPELREESIFI